VQFYPGQYISGGFYSGTSNNGITSASSYAVTLIWTHIALTSDGTTMRLFINGVSVGTPLTVTGVSINAPSSATFKIGNYSNSQYFYGYISNLRFVKGSAVYTSAFTPPTGPLQNITNTSLLTCQSSTFVDNSSNNFTITTNGSPKISNVTPFQAYNPYNLNPALGASTPGVWTLDQARNAEVTRSWPMYDPYYNYTTVNLHGNGTNGAQNNTFLDSSTNAFTITRNGTPTQGSFSPYGSLWSNYFSGSTDYLSVTGTNIAPGAGDFTAEFWINGTYAGVKVLIDWAAAPQLYMSGTSIVWYFNADRISGTLTNNTWQHVAIVRASGVTKMYIDGVAVTQTFTDSTSITPTTFTIGGRAGSTGNTINGYMSNVRLVKGTAVYTSNFTPSTTSLTAITNTSLLTCQSNRFIDNSSNAYAISVGAGSPQVQRFNPFLPTSSQAYSTSVYGGSGYFKGGGSGDSLVTPSITIGTNAFCFECWIYPTVVQNANAPGLFVSTTSNGLQAGYYSNVGLGIAQKGVAYQVYEGTILPTVGAWNHVAFVRSGTGTNQTSIYLNGVRVANGTVSYSYAAATYSISIVDPDFTVFYGYIGECRFTNGSSPYDATQSTITIPTSPFTAITNTALLLNYTNAGIYDNAMMENWITVGSAQVNTSTVKYGTGSLYFDGSGSYLSGPAFNVGMNPCSGDFTVEFWAYISSLPGVERPIVATITSGGSGLLIGLGGGGNVNKIQFAIGNLSVGNPTVVDSSTFPVATWTHIAAVRQNGILYLYKNGTSVGTPTSASGTISQPTITVGAWPGGSAVFLGYLDDVRISLFARYKASFTPPTSQLQDQ
jgi:hypothetical protein